MSNDKRDDEIADALFDPCRKYACEYQDCLKRWNLKESKCIHVIEKLKECCHANYVLKANPFGRVSPTCSGFVKISSEIK